MVPSIIGGKYRIVSQLGRGGSAVVYRAEHMGLGRTVAVKVLMDIAKSSEEMGHEALSRFDREARAAGTIETMHIVRVYDTGVDETLRRPFLVMELLDGEDVNRLVQRLGPQPPEVAVRIVRQACAGLVKAHEAGVIHRDIKPANLFLAKNEGGDLIVKLLDFGIAKVGSGALTEEEGALTQTGSMLGSPHYMSPEQVESPRLVDARTDLWSLGVVLFKLLCGRTPYERCQSLGQLFVALCSAEPPSVQDYASWIPDEVAYIAERALQVDRDERYATASEMLADLDALLPDGARIAPSMLASLPMQQQNEVAKRFEELGADFTRSTSLSRRESTTERRRRSVTGRSVFTVAKTEGGRRRRFGVLAGGALVFLAGTGFLVSQLVKPHRNGAVSGSVAVPSPAPTRTEPEVKSAIPEEVRVPVQVVPAGALVDVDGVSTAVEGGVVYLHGAVGSPHTVRLRSGGREHTAQVVIAQTGAVPARVEMVAMAVAHTHPKARVAAPMPTPGVTATPAVTAAPRHSGFDSDFE